MRLAVFLIQARDQLIDGWQIVNFPDTLPGRPYRFPCFGFIGKRLEFIACPRFAFTLECGEVETCVFKALAHKTGGYT